MFHGVLSYRLLSLYYSSIISLIWLKGLSFYNDDSTQRFSTPFTSLPILQKLSNSERRSPDARSVQSRITEYMTRCSTLQVEQPMSSEHCFCELYYFICIFLFVLSITEHLFEIFSLFYQYFLKHFTILWTVKHEEGKNNTGHFSIRVDSQSGTL